MIKYIIPLTIFLYISIVAFKSYDLFEAGNYNVYFKKNNMKMSITDNIKKLPLKVTKAAAKGDKEELKDPFEKELKNIDFDEKKPEEAAVVHRNCDSIEMGILKTLGTRRAQLEAWSREARSKEDILNATSQRIENRISDLRALRIEVQELISKFESRETERINRLVKIYESMKPLEAARIFDQLDMSVILQVMGKMKEKKVADIISKMDPEKAKVITLEFIEQRKLPDFRANGQN